MKRYVLFALMALCFGLLLAPVEARADTINWQIKSLSKYQVNVKFYATKRNNQWPSTTTHYPLRDSNMQKISISCLRGEQVCYGATIANSKTYWGRGPTGKAACSGCCYTCTGNVNTKPITLTDKR